MGGRVTLGFKLRWVGFGEFDGESEYDYLRGHASVAGNPPMPVTYYVRTDDIGFLAFSLEMTSPLLTGYGPVIGRARARERGAFNGPSSLGQVVTVKTR